jgi:uncharacterized repeat protein (TIGR03803 family)
MITKYTDKLFDLCGRPENNTSARRRCQFAALFIIAFLCAATAIAAQAQTCTVLYNFGVNPVRPNDPIFQGVMAQGRDGDLYTGSRDEWTGSDGTVFKMTPAGKLTVLHLFDGTDGDDPSGGLTLGTDGMFYGATPGGGLYSYGTVFKMTPSGELTTIHNFTGGDDGGYPMAPPIEASDGNFYGTTSYGGATGNIGTIYRVTPSGVLTTLNSFGLSSSSAGDYANGPLVQGTDGFLYGTTHYGGPDDLGTIFSASPLTGQITTMFSFDGTNGGNPLAALIQASDGNFYGTTAGVSNGGTAFRISAGGEFTVLHTFTGRSDGANPVGGLTQATDENLYGTSTFGPAYRLSLGGVLTPLCGVGGSPQNMLLQHTNGTLYGTSAVGGSGDRGMFFSLNVGLGPFVSFLPAARIVGAKAQILGQGFNDATAVSFNGTPATFKVESDTFMTATVPTGATTGDLTVTEPSGTLTSNKPFRVLPTTQGFVPNNGPAGTVVTISGMALTQTTAVSFDGVQATSFSVISDTELQATVPEGAKTGYIEITTAGGSFTTCNKFYVTP